MIKISGYLDYRTLLRDLLNERISKNSLLSARTFCARANISPSYFSRVLSGQRGLSTEVAIRLAQAFDLSKSDTTHFLDLVALEQARNQKQKDEILSRLARRNRNVRYLALDSFQIVAEWYHFAILSLVNTRSFRPDPKWIARRLGIDPFQARIALDRLIELELLKVEGQKVSLINPAESIWTNLSDCGFIRECDRMPGSLIIRRWRSCGFAA